MSVTYHRLFFRCPACMNGPATHWYHSDCGSPLEVGNDATIRCAGCLYSSHIRYWRYSCANHQGDYRSTTSAQLAGSMSMSAALLAAGGRMWLISVLDHLLDW